MNTRFMSANLLIAVAQTRPTDADVDANIAEHLELASTAIARGAKLVLFPELSLTGYDLPHAAELAFSQRDARLDPLLELAATRVVTLIVGAPVRIGTQLHIGAFILRPDTRIDLYTKRRLGTFSPTAARDGTVPPSEETFFAPGDRNPTVELRNTRAAVAICADISDSNHAAQAAKRGALAYLASVFVIPSEYAVESARLQSYAIRYSFVVAMSNFGAATGGLAAAGCSTIWSSSGEPLVQLGAAGAGIGVASVSESSRTAVVMFS